ncbi:MAG: ribosomal protein S27E [Halioglobus sp.]|jgi:ribosomal protein S27E
MLSPGKDALGHATYKRHRPEQTLLYQLVDKHYPTLIGQLESHGKSLPAHVHREFEAYLKCGRLEHGFLRVRCDKCHFERLVAFACKKRGFCPSCGARRMAETAALLSDEVFPDLPLRQRKYIGQAPHIESISANHLNDPRARDTVANTLFTASLPHAKTSKGDSLPV